MFFGTPEKFLPGFWREQIFTLKAKAEWAQVVVFLLQKLDLVTKASQKFEPCLENVREFEKLAYILIFPNVYLSKQTFKFGLRNISAASCIYKSVGTGNTEFFVMLKHRRQKLPSEVNISKLKWQEWQHCRKEKSGLFRHDRPNFSWSLEVWDFQKSKFIETPTCLLYSALHTLGIKVSMQQGVFVAFHAINCISMPKITVIFI